MIGQQMMAVLVAFLLIASTSCLIILASYFSALPVNKKNLVTRWAIKRYFKIHPELSCNVGDDIYIYTNVFQDIS